MKKIASVIILFIVVNSVYSQEKIQEKSVNSTTELNEVDLENKKVKNELNGKLVKTSEYSKMEEEKRKIAIKEEENE